MEQFDQLWQATIIVLIFAGVIGLGVILGAEIGYGPIDKILKNAQKNGFNAKSLIFIILIVVGGGGLVIGAIYYFMKSKFEEVKVGPVPPPHAIYRSYS